MGIYRELLLKSQVDERLLSMTSEEGEQAVEKSNRETEQHPHGEAILRDRLVQNEPESRI